MKSFVLALALAAAAMFLPQPASAAVDGYATATVNMRAGPGTRYRVIAVIPRGSPVIIYSCLSYRNWCEVGWRWHRGWVHGRYLSETGVYEPYLPPVYVYPPAIFFDFDIYRDRPHRRPPVYHRPPPRPRVHRAPPRPRIHRAPPRAEIHRAPPRARIHRAPPVRRMEAVPELRRDSGSRRRAPERIERRRDQSGSGYSGRKRSRRGNIIEPPS